MWEQNNFGGMLSAQRFPAYDEAKTVDAEVEIAVQVNGKLRARAKVPAGAAKDAVLASVKALPEVAAQLAGKTVVKEIVVPDKLVNIVVK